MTRAPDGFRLPRRHIAHFLDTVAWAGATIRDEGGRLVVRDDHGGLLQAEVTARECAFGRGGQGKGRRCWDEYGNFSSHETPIYARRHVWEGGRQ